MHYSFAKSYGVLHSRHTVGHMKSHVVHNLQTPCAQSVYLRLVCRIAAFHLKATVLNVDKVALVDKTGKWLAIKPFNVRKPLNTLLVGCLPFNPPRAYLHPQ